MSQNRMRQQPGFSPARQDKPADAPQEQKPQPAQQQFSQQAPQQQPVQQTPEPAPFVMRAAEQLQREPPRQQEQKQEQQTLVSGLLDRPVDGASKPTFAQSPVPSAPVVTATGPEPSPTAVRPDEAFGSVPQVMPYQMEKSITDEVPRRVFEQQDGWPSKSPSFMQSQHTSDLGFRMQSNGPPANYAPAFSYQRR